MLNQLDLIRDTAWDVLLVLDACRADVYRQEVRAEWQAGLQTVASPASCTRDWIRAVGPTLAEKGVLYFSANSYILREEQIYRWGLDIVPVWRHHTQPCADSWNTRRQEHGRTVHPWVLADYVVNVISDSDRYERVVVHFIQPHAPSIEGGYRGSLVLADRAARWIAHCLGGTCVITGDHGELMGEHGLHSHPCEETWPELREVPWLVLKDGEPHDETQGTMDNLRALGYV